MNTKQLTESEVRALRNRVFCQNVSDNEWEKCRGHWMSASGISFLLSHDFPISESNQRYAAWASKPPTLQKKSC